MSNKNRNYLWFLPMVLSFCLALTFLLTLLNTPAKAMTMEYLKEYVEDLEKEQRETQKELNKYKGELKNITRDGATLNERKEYTDRVIELMKKLETLEKRREELLKEARKMPHAPPILKLVAIEVAENISDYEKVGAGLISRRQSEVNVRNGAGDTGLVDTILSLRIVKAPLEIRPSEPFEIAAEAQMRKSYPDDHWCLWRGDEEKEPDLSIAVSSKEINAFLKGERSLESYCDEGRVQKHEWPLSADRIWYNKDATIKADSVNLTVRFKPIKQEISGSSQHFYYDADASGGRGLNLDVKTQYPFFAFDFPTDSRGYLLPTTDTRTASGTRVSNGITVNIRIPLVCALLLRYEPVHETDPVISSLSIPDHPSEFFEPLKEGAVRSVHVVPNVVDKKVDDAIKELKNVGLDVDPRIGKSAPEKKLESNVYSQKPMAGERINRGARVELVVYGQHAGLIKIPKVAQESMARAREMIESLGLKVFLGPGSPANRPALNGRIEGTDPPEGNLVKRGTTILVKVHSNYIDVREVPNVYGLSAGEAKSRIAAMGLNAAMKAGGTPPTRAKEETVERQHPDTGTSVAPGSEVTLFIYGPFVQTVVVPEVRGLSYPDSKRKLETAGLTIDRRDAGKPAERRLAEMAQRQEPAAGTRVSKGSAVYVWVFGQYIATREEQVATTDCSRFPESREYWDNNAGKPMCGCFDGLQWNLANTQCVTANVRANEVCAREGQGLVARGTNSEGRINCVCLEGFVWNASRKACEKQLSPQELCAQHIPGSVPAGRDENNKVICDCPQGYVWKDTSKTACVKQLSPQEICNRDRSGSVARGRDANGNINCECPQGLVWTADGKRCVKSEGQAAASGAGLICFTRREGNAISLMVISPDGRNLKKIAENGVDPMLSYDGKWIAYKVNSMSNSPIEICRVDGSERRRIATDGANYNRPKWTADGRKLFFAYAPPGNDPDWRLGWMNSDGSGLGQTPFNAFGGHTYLPAPDGRRAVFVGWSNVGQGLFVVNVGAPLKTGRQITYSRHPVADYGASWSPDSSTIAFIRTGNKGVNSLCTVSAQGGSVRVIVSNIRCGLRTAWSPDGKQIMIVQKIATGGGREEGQLVFVSVVDGTIRQFTDAAIGVLDVDWR